MDEADKFGASWFETRFALLTMRVGGLITLLAALASTPAAAAPQLDTAGATSCKTAGYLKDTDPRGTNVRSAPRADAPVIGHLPPRRPLEPGSDDIVGAEFEIVGSKNGWLLIRDARAGDAPEPVFKGPGWISGGLVGFTLGGSSLLEAPDHEARALAKLSGELKDGSGYGPDSYDVLRVHGCERHYVDVTIRLAPSVMKGAGPMRGWVNKACSTQLTTCDPGFVPTPFDTTHNLAEVRSDCIEGVGELLDGETCKVADFGDIGAVGGRTFRYAIYGLATRDGVTINTQALVFEQKADGTLRLRISADGNDGRFGKPSLLRSGGATLLHFPNSESGTGNFNHERLYVWRDGWKEIDTDSWQQALAARLPKGLAVWKGIYPDYARMTARTPLWRKDDANACPTGGRAEIALALRGDRIVVRDVQLRPRRGDCSDE